MMKTLNIRKGTEEDIARIGQFYDDVVLWLNGHVNYPRWIYKVYPSESSVRDMVNSGCQYICEDEDSILAAFALNSEAQGDYQKGNWSLDLPDGSYMVIHALATDPQKQRHGIGTEILQFCVTRAKAENYKAIRADIVPTNDPARRLFEKNGFVYVGDTDLELSIGGIPEFLIYE